MKEAFQTTANGPADKLLAPLDPRERANPSCRKCSGTGISGRLVQGFDQDGPDEKILAPRISLTCKCVYRANIEKVPWLQRHGIDKQPWLKEDENEEHAQVVEGHTQEF